MEHKHSIHESCCNHEHIKFCRLCAKPYCEDCGKEWEERCTLAHYQPWTTYYIPWTGPMQPNTTIPQYYTNATVCQWLTPENKPD